MPPPGIQHRHTNPSPVQARARHSFATLKAAGQQISTLKPDRHVNTIDRSSANDRFEATSEPVIQHGEICESSQLCRSPTTSSSSSMCSNRNKLTPEGGSPPDDHSQTAITSGNNRFSKLRIKSRSPASQLMGKSSCPLKRRATDEPSSVAECRPPEWHWRDPTLSNGEQRSYTQASCQPRPKYQRHESCRGSGSQNSCQGSSPHRISDQHRFNVKPDRHDSGFDMEVEPCVQPLTKSIKLEKPKTFNATITDFQESIGDPDSQLIPQDSLHLRGKRKYPGIALQPEFSPISQEQLAAEVKGIYAGLVMVEAKCINIDSQKAAHPEEPLTTEQWQALVALHRTLLYEHHDFLMATQHPSANNALVGLAHKYTMPARMWKHGIHAFLEVLRHRRPDSQEYMLAFIYLAYQMMSLLLETVPTFTDTWIECLGDLARYRMAIEEDREIHTIWGGVAGRWYVMAADRNPDVGRLYHHSGILERPSLRKFYLYSRALTSKFPFLNAKESLGTLSSPLLNDEQALGSRSAEALVICFHARVFALQHTDLLERACSAALNILDEQPDSKIAVYGVPFAVTNIAALLGFGTPNNILRQLFDSALGRDILQSRPSQDRPSAFQLTDHSAFLDLDGAQYPEDPVISFFFHSFNDIIRRKPKSDSLPGLLPYVHTMLIFIASIDTLQSRLSGNHAALDTLDNLLDFGRMDWSALSHFLNLIAKSFPITSRTEAFASGETFPCDGVPLLEDYMIRGLEWAQWYFAPDWFANIEDDDGSRCLEDDSKRQHRAARVFYLAMLLAKKCPSHLSYDHDTRRFSAPAGSLNYDAESSVTQSPCSMTARRGGDSSVESDYVLVSKSSSPTPPHKPYVHSVGSRKRAGGTADRHQRPSLSKMQDHYRAASEVTIVGETGLD